jgi:hypothetical protein
MRHDLEIQNLNSLRSTRKEFENNKGPQSYVIPIVATDYKESHFRDKVFPFSVVRRCCESESQSSVLFSDARVVG